MYGKASRNGHFPKNHKKLSINSNITQELLENIERYHNGTMEPEELKSFKNRLENDEPFKQLVDDVRSLLMGVETQSLKEKLNEFHQELETPSAVKMIDGKARFLQFRKIATAAIVVIALGSVWFFVGSTNERLFDNHFRPDPGLPTTMGSSENFEFFDAMVDYKQENYGKAINKWLALYERAPQNDTIAYFLGSAYLANGNQKLALEYLEKTVENPQSAFKSDAQYYLGLINLKNGKTEEARKNLLQSHHEGAKTLLDKLKD